MSDIRDQNSIETALAELAGKYLTFRLADEEYGLQILKVREIIGLMDITVVPRTPSYIRGVINLRGKVIPVVDLRRKFALDSVDGTDRTCIVVVQIERGDEEVIMGVLVDEVSEVIDLALDQLESPPTFGTAVDTAFLLGIGKIAKRVLILLDIDRVLSSEEIAAVTQVGGET